MPKMISEHDLTHRKIDTTREDVRKLHPLLQLLDSEETDVTVEFAERLIGLLIDVEERLSQQTDAFTRLADKMDRLSEKLEEMRTDIAFLKGVPERE
ncbi:hypothetical protein [Tateyamaria omphalii]|uniref:Uncharacterized protein n=1 Tax=Tateyamaria omphalii TaxID=299262 RepID=A0A1P8MTL1_9RHOB|nr:hypothetical protein [Tateyamaria omphalii]APX11375.1 hypothetical protein BWR18_06530 [Tateyamaria omphalii]